MLFFHFAVIELTVLNSDKVNKSVKVEFIISEWDLKCRRKYRDKTVANLRLDWILTSTTTHIYPLIRYFIVARGHRSKHRARITIRVKCYVKKMEMKAVPAAAAQFTRKKKSRQIAVIIEIWCLLRFATMAHECAHAHCTYDWFAMKPNFTHR